MDTDMSTRKATLVVAALGLGALVSVFFLGSCVGLVVTGMARFVGPG